MAGRPSCPQFRASDAITNADLEYKNGRGPRDLKPGHDLEVCVPSSTETDFEGLTTFDFSDSPLNGFREPLSRSDCYRKLLHDDHES
jgi:hypothetical protein